MGDVKSLTFDQFFLEWIHTKGHRASEPGYRGIGQFSTMFNVLYYLTDDFHAVFLPDPTRHGLTTDEKVKKMPAYSLPPAGVHLAHLNSAIDRTALHFPRIDKRSTEYVEGAKMLEKASVCWMAYNIFGTELNGCKSTEYKSIHRYAFPFGSHHSWKCQK